MRGKRPTPPFASSRCLPPIVAGLLAAACTAAPADRASEIASLPPVDAPATGTPTEWSTVSKAVPDAPIDPSAPPAPSSTPAPTPSPASALTTSPTAPFTLPPVRLERVAGGLMYPVALAWGPAPAGTDRAGETVLYVATNGELFPPESRSPGEIWWLDGDRPRRFAGGLHRPLGLLAVTTAGVPELLVGTRGKVAAWRDVDGDGLGEETRVLVDGLPAWDLHQNDSLVLGPDGLVYMGVGTKTNADAAAEDALNGTILRFPVTGSAGGGSIEPEVFATGLRNPFDLAFTADGTLFATDNGVDPPTVQDAPEELDLVIQGGFYGHPLVFGLDAPSPAAAAMNPRPPIATFPPHASANGLLYYTGALFPELQGRLLVAEFGSYLGGYEDAGRRIVVVVLHGAAGADGPTVVPLVDDFPGRPLDLAQGPDGAIYVADFESNAVWRLVR